MPNHSFLGTVAVNVSSSEAVLSTFSTFGPTFTLIDDEYYPRT